MEEILLPHEIYHNPISRNDNDSFSKLYSAEMEFMPNPIYAQTTQNCAFRGLAITFMELNSAHEKFDAFIPYLAMTYVDRFVSVRDIPNVIRGSRSKNIFLFLTCCLSIASKMRNDNVKIAKILQLRKPMLKYETEDASQMEGVICEGLQWKMRSLTPICFVDYFINLLRCQSPVHPSIPRRSVHHTIIKSQGVIKLTNYRPSHVAASAVLTASFRLYPENYDEFKQLILSSEHICKNCMEEASEYIEMVEQICETGPSEGMVTKKVSSSSADPSSVMTSSVDEIPRDRDGLMDFKLDWTTVSSRISQSRQGFPSPTEEN